MAQVLLILLHSMKWLKEQGIDLGEKNSNSWTSLHHALRNGQLELVKWLKAQGADIREKTRYGFYAMDLASQNEYSDPVRWLQEQGATTGAFN